MLAGDYHTHTTYSHGKNSVLENAQVAKEKGLKEIAITDHGFNHLIFSLKRKRLKELRKDIDNAIEKTGINVYLGVEANLITTNGDIDVKPQDYDYLEVLVVGFHKCAKAPFFHFFNFIIGNVLSDIFKVFSKKRIQKNTEAYCLAVRKNPIDIISHLNYVCKVDCKKVAQACAETNTYIEINSKRRHFSKEEVLAMLETDVKFVIDSDAHSCGRVGDVKLALEVAKEYGIPEERIVNLHSEIEIKKKK